MSKFKKYIKFGLVAVLAAGCDTKSLHDLNINPQALNEIDLNYLIHKCRTWNCFQRIFR
jgi:hypothetical protein